MRAQTLETQVPVVPHWQGINNKPADIASRSFDPKNSCYSPNDTNFVKFSNSNNPLPQNCSWLLHEVPPGPLSKLISTLRGGRLGLRQWTYPLASATGGSGASTAPTMATRTLTWPASPSTPDPRLWWLSLLESVQDNLGVANR
jgi:hypothetical protein